MSLKPIDRASVRRICSSQVIVDLQSAVKELVENSLDGDAKYIEIRFKNYGIDGFDVIDDGSGICPEDYEALGTSAHAPSRRHYTSKLSQFSDLDALATLGFRGEALASLCAMAKVSVVTCTAEQDRVGTLLEYDSAGELVSQQRVPARRGTTVSVSDFMMQYPVRRTEFVKNVKRDFARCVQALQAYAIVSKSVRFNCFNIGRKSERVTVFSTPGKDTIRGNVLDLHGGKLSKQVDEVHLTLAGVNGSAQGVLSRPHAGCGRAAADKQYMFINGRPCDLPKVARVITETYRSYNSQQYPFIALDMTLSPDSYDVNVTPDKRTLLLHNEDTLLSELQAQLTQHWETSLGTFQLADVSGSQDQVSQTESTSFRSMSTPTQMEEDDFASGMSSPTKRLSLAPQLTTPDDGRVQRRIMSLELPGPQQTPPSHERKRMKTFDAVSESSARVDALLQTFRIRATEAAAAPVPAVVTIDDDDDGRDDLAPSYPNEAAAPLVVEVDDPGPPHLSADDRPTAMVHFSLQALRPLGSVVRMSCYQPLMSQGSQGSIGLKDIADEAAEEELPRVISKDDFLAMRVIGQFNRGFIIAQLCKALPSEHAAPHSGQRGNDLFIIDQHASDEKYNFEMLQRDDVVQIQKLILPRVMPLSPVDEIIAMEHEAVIRQNGFGIQYDEERPPGQRISIWGMPLIRGHQFSQQDLEELIRLAAQGPGVQLVRPSRLRALYASKACRKSVMIGMPLDKREMTRIVRNLNTIDKPWTCPHSRPTMRILFNMAALERKTATHDRYRCSWQGSLFARL
ncbi:ATP-binding mismatch repair protein [Sorochytrium milnesiophthora]